MLSMQPARSFGNALGNGLGNSASWKDKKTDVVKFAEFREV